MNLGRNDPCPCGSGKKFKKCCQGKSEHPLPLQSRQQKANTIAPGVSKRATPNPAELKQLVALFNAGYHAELEKQACSLLECYPDSGIAWKILGATLQVQGKNSLPALRKATEFLSGDAEAHYNLGNAFLALSRLDEAEASYRRALEIRPDDADVYFNLGNTLRNLHRLDEAEACYRRALQVRPDFAEVHGNLGNIRLEQGRLEEAEASYRWALQIKPGYAVAHYNLGNIFHDMGRIDEARASYQGALKAKPDFAEAYYGLGKVFQDMGHLSEAEASYRQALKVKPDFAQAYFNIGRVFQDNGRLSEAEISYRWALKVKPDFAEAYCGMGSVLRDTGRLTESETNYRQALQVKSDFAEAYCGLGDVFQDMGRLPEAETNYRQALQIEPGSAMAYSRFADFFLELGRIDEAEINLRRALEIKPDFIEARLTVALARKVKPDDENLAALIAAEEGVQNSATPLPDKSAVFLHFALGKCYDDTGDYEKAFSHFNEGCKLKRATFDCTPDQNDRVFASIMRNLDAAAIDRLSGGGDLSQLPVFVLGMPRSGTTLTEQIIASHPEVYGAGELPDLMSIAQRKIEGADFPDSLRLLDQARLAAWGTEYIAGLQRRAPDARRITDKMPGNFQAVGLIHLMLPNAKIIHVNRNPVDTCLSCFTKLFKHKHEYTYDLAELGRYYAGYARMMEHWRKVLPTGAFLDVQYEDIVADQEGQSRRLIEYCGLEWDDACLDFHRSKRAVRTASMAQVRQPMYKSSVERWRLYEKHLKPLLDALGELAPDC